MVTRGGANKEVDQCKLRISTVATRFLDCRIERFTACYLLGNSIINLEVLSHTWHRYHVSSYVVSARTRVTPSVAVCVVRGWTEISEPPSPWGASSFAGLERRSRQHGLSGGHRKKNLTFGTPDGTSSSTTSNWSAESSTTSTRTIEKISNSAAKRLLGFKRFFHVTDCVFIMWVVEQHVRWTRRTWNRGNVGDMPVKRAIRDHAHGPVHVYESWWRRTRATTDTLRRTRWVRPCVRADSHILVHLTGSSVCRTRISWSNIVVESCNCLSVEIK